MPGPGGVGGVTPFKIIDNFYHFNQLKYQKTNMRKDLLTLFYTYRIKLLKFWLEFKNCSRILTEFCSSCRIQNIGEKKILMTDLIVNHMNSAGWYRILIEFCCDFEF